MMPLNTDTDHVLDVDARRELYRLVDAYPGLHLSELARRSNLDTNHAKYHLRVLERRSFVSSRHDGIYWRFYPRRSGALGRSDVVDREEKEILAMLRRRVPLNIALVLQYQESATLGELAEAVDVAPSTLHYHANRMEASGILRSVHEGRVRRLSLADPEAVEGVLQRFRPPRELVETLPVAPGATA